MILFQNRRKIQGFLIFSLLKRIYLNRQRKRKEGYVYLCTCMLISQGCGHFRVLNEETISKYILI